jgi:hypothetical protein
MTARLGLRDIVTDHELEDWNVSRGMAVLYLVVPPVGAVVVALTGFWDPLYRLLTAEDHLFEWAQFACWLVGGVASAAMAIRILHRNRLLGILWATLAVGLLVVAGEEIAWGQRLLELQTPTVLKRVNAQGELTTHNVRGLSAVYAAVFVVAGIYGSVTAYWYRYRHPEQVTGFIDLVVPPMFTASLFLVNPGYKVVRAALNLAGVPPLNDYAEYIELCLALGLASFCCLSLRRDRHRSSVDRVPRRHRRRGSARDRALVR